MTNEQKLAKLLQIAVENGFVDTFSDLTIGGKSIKIVNCTVENGWTGDDKESYSLNDLILNWEEGQISFIKALIKASKIEDVVSTSSQFYRTIWIQKPTSQRLDYLFTTFQHLL